MTVLHDSLDSLRSAAAYPGDATAAEGVDWIQTHISHLFLTPARVYKFRKAVDLGFVCFETLAERNADCLREVALNRRLAPDVYLGVAPLIAGEPPHVGAVAETLADPGVEHCVVMRRLPTGRDALTLLRGGCFERSHVERFARRLARFHESVGLGVPAPYSPDEWREACTAAFADCLQTLAREVRGAAQLQVLALLEKRFSTARVALGARFEERRRAGRAVDGHGDLHLEHVWLETGAAEPLIVDCLEFSQGLRRIDAASDVAFAAMDFSYRGRPYLGEHLLRCYARERGDEDLFGVIDFFAGYRAAVRAKVAALAALDPEIEGAQRDAARESATRHLSLAAAFLETPTPRNLVLVGGVVGTGKSTVADALADELEGAGGAVVISSDRVRKQVHGASEAHSRLDGGRYAPAARTKIYDELLSLASTVLGSGRMAILDATWSRRADRDRARALACEFGVRCVVLETCCEEIATLERLARRAARGESLSDAGPELYASSHARFEPCGPDEAEDWRRVATEKATWRQELPELSVWVQR
ncbi:MAG: AAA family ATPase [Deltaproteobacteria bacterium]|nr:AAA family ATPase [Deltaproteobacteria bacterium]MBW2360930.1 AAA family ATPase [Deltaproteobacteria bacterium]